MDDYASLNAHYDNTLLGRFDREWLSRRQVPMLLMVVLAVIVALASIKFFDGFSTLEHSEHRDRMKRATALGRWMADPQALVDGGNPYGEGHWFPNPPLVLLALTPLIYLPPTVAAVVWVIGKYLALVATFWMLASALGNGRARAPTGVLLVAGLFALRPLVGDVQHGNLNIFVLFEVVGVWALFVHRRDSAAGLLLALAIVTKVTPALLLLYFLYKRAWRVVAATGVGLLLGFIVIPGVLVGFERNWFLLTAWSQLIIEPYTVHGFVTILPINQSLPGWVMKLCILPTDWHRFLLPGDDPALVQVFDRDPIQLGALGAWIQRTFPIETIAEFRPDYRLVTGEGAMARPAAFATTALVKGASALVIALLAWLCRTPAQDRRDPRLALEFSLVLIAMLLLSERTWKHHMTTLLPVFAATWLVISGQPWSRRFRAATVAVAVAALMLLNFGGDVLMFIGIITAGLFVVFALNAVMLRRWSRRAGGGA